MNIFCFAGNLTKEPELKSTQSGKQVASFSVAINEGKDKTLFINCVAWEKTGELIAQYCQKGDRFSGSGKLSIRKYDDKDGVTKYVTEIIVHEFDFPPKGNADKPAQKPVERDDDIAQDIPF